MSVKMSEVLLLPPATSAGDAVFHCESETTFFGFPNVWAFLINYKNPAETCALLLGDM